MNPVGSNATNYRYKKLRPGLKAGMLRMDIHAFRVDLIVSSRNKKLELTYIFYLN